MLFSPWRNGGTEQWHDLAGVIWQNVAFSRIFPIPKTQNLGDLAAGRQVREGRQQQKTAAWLLTAAPSEITLYRGAWQSSSPHSLMCLLKTIALKLPPVLKLMYCPLPPRVRLCRGKLCWADSCQNCIIRDGKTWEVALRRYLLGWEQLFFLCWKNTVFFY